MSKGALEESVLTNWFADCSLTNRQVLSYVIVSAYQLYRSLYLPHGNYFIVLFLSP